MDRLPLVVSFYTLNTPYEEDARCLIASCEKFNVEHQVDGLPSAGSWEMNCAFKPLFLLKKMEELKRPLLWVDVDAVFLQPISHLKEFSLDIGVRLFDCPDDHPSRIGSGTLFMNATEGGRKIVHLWAQKCLSMLQEKDRKEEVWDQDALRRVLFDENPQVNWGALPMSYLIIAGHPESEKCKEPVILQYQASRMYKRWINHPEERIF